jgi:predicted ABC-type ATPase
MLERAILHRLDFAFETTLGGSTITRLLSEAIAARIEVHVWYVGLADVRLHVARVRARVLAGGHDIAGNVIERRFDHSRLNLIHLLPGLASLRVYDNSADADPARGVAPRPMLVLATIGGRIVAPRDLSRIPGWAKPIVAAALTVAAAATHR